MSPARAISVLTWLLLTLLLGSFPAHAVAQTPPSWARHTIDSTSRGADGVRLNDVNADGHLDIVTGWEEGGVIRVYVNPGPERATSPWPSVSVGNVQSPEDAFFVDIDQDGAIDVVSSCEGKTRTMHVHWAPKAIGEFLEPEKWTTEAIPCTQGQQMWMFATPLTTHQDAPACFVVGSKGANGSIGILRPGDKPRDVTTWQLEKIADAGWIMTLDTRDMDNDGDLDIVASDRKRAKRGIWWFEQPDNPDTSQRWTRHLVGGKAREVMFLDIADLDSDGIEEILCATRSDEILIYKRQTNDSWSETSIPNPNGVPFGKAIRAGDIDLDGEPDLVHTANNQGIREHRGVTWLKRSDKNGKVSWKVFDISGERGIKFDLIQPLDLDGDGDLDVLTCEERDNLGVFWYENPTR